MSEAEYVAPKVSVSYSWQDEAHLHWVGEFAARLRGDGVDVSLDQWMVTVLTIPYSLCFRSL